MRFLFVFTCSLLACAGAHATLGGPPSALAGVDGAAQVQARKLAAGSSAGSVAGSNVTVQQTTLDGGTVVREYVGDGGKVFAVSWNGPFLPDLRTLLGERFAMLQAAQAQAQDGRGRGRGRPRVDAADLVIESSGHMRAYAGRAWIVSALPAGFTPDAIQ